MSDHSPLIHIELGPAGLGTETLCYLDILKTTSEWLLVLALTFFPPPLTQLHGRNLHLIKQLLADGASHGSLRALPGFVFLKSTHDCSQANQHIPMGFLGRN